MMPTNSFTQDYCHVSADLRNEYCDLYLASCHKWLQGFHPMGLGFYGRRSRSMIETALGQLLSSGDLDDPLLRLTVQMETATLDGETVAVNLIALFTSQGAAADALERSSPLPSLWACGAELWPRQQRWPDRNHDGLR